MSAEQSSGAFDALLQEERRYPRPPDFKAQATWAMLAPTSGDRRSEGFWGAGRSLDWFVGRCWSGTRPGPSGSSAASSTPVTTASIATRHLAPQQGRDHLGGRAGRRARADLPATCTARSTGSPTSLKQLGRREGRPRRDLHADGPRAADRHAGLRPDRRAAHASSSAASAPRSSPTAINDCRGQGRHHRRRRLAARQRRAAQGRTSTRRCASRPTVEQVRRGASAPATQHGRRCKTGRDVWWHDADGRRVGATVPPSRWTPSTRSTSSTRPARPASRRACCTPPAGYLLGTSLTHEVGLRPQGRRRLLVYRRHRLGDRPQLHRLRAAGERRDRASCTRARPTTRTRTASGRSSRSTA